MHILKHSGVDPKVVNGFKKTMGLLQNKNKACDAISYDSSHRFFDMHLLPITTFIL